MQKKKIMIIGAGILQLPAIIRAKELGYEVISVDMNPNAIGLNYCDVKCIVSTNDIDGVLQAASKYKPDGVMTLATDMPVRTVAAIGDKFKLNTISQATAIKVTDKSEMRKALEDANVPIPNFYVVNNFKDYIRAAKNFKGNFIVKPSDSSGSRGVYLVKEHSQLEAAYRHSSNNSRNGNVLLEEFMVGPEVSVETFSINGTVNIIAITDKLTTGAPHFVELGHSIPSSLNKDIIMEIEKVAKLAVKSLGIENGPSHTEIIVTDKGPKIVEIGARLGGDNITTYLVPLATGINMVDLNIKYALNEKISIERNISMASCVRYLPSKPGQIKNISGVTEARDTKGVIVVDVSKKVGEQATEVQSSIDRIGYVITQADNLSEARKICHSACNKIKIETI